jgi:hypothetical protein
MCWRQQARRGSPSFFVKQIETSEDIASQISVDAEAQFGMFGAVLPPTAVARKEVGPGGGTVTCSAYRRREVAERWREKGVSDAVVVGLLIGRHPDEWGALDATCGGGALTVRRSHSSNGGEDARGARKERPKRRNRLRHVRLRILVLSSAGPPLLQQRTVGI